MTSQAVTPVVLITGAAGGIGACTARMLAEAGYALALSDLAGDRLKHLGADLGSEGVHVSTTTADITEPASVAGMVDHSLAAHGRIDALIHCAGLDAPPGQAWEEEPDHWRRIIDVDLNGAWWCTRAVLPHMLARGSGRIILIGSVAARTANPVTSVAYNAAKSGINGLVVGLSTQLEGKGILVNAIAPGPTGTGNAMTADEVATYRRQYPLGEGGAEPVAHACLHLLGKSGDWLSGTVMNVSGGRIRG